MAVKTVSNAASMMPKNSTAPVKKEGKTVLDYLNGDSFKSQLAMALPKHLSGDHFVRSAISEFRLNPQLQECSVPSILGYFMQAAAMGLEPASSLGQCYPVPFYNKKTGGKEVQFMMSYRGMLTLARNSGEVQSVRAHAVHMKDEFEIQYGLNEDIIHKPYIDGDAGAFRGAYVIVQFKDGTQQALFMSKSEIDAHRARSKSSGGFSPWQTDYEAMALKTVFRAIFKWLPISIEHMVNMASDESVVRLKPDAVNADSVEDMLEVEFVAAEDEPEVTMDTSVKTDESERSAL